MQSEEADTTKRYVIWSEEHGAWWRPGKRGYTRQLAKAGRYEKAEAEEIVTKANKYPPTGMAWSEVTISDPMEAHV
jgi:hypothetical protein